MVKYHPDTRFLTDYVAGSLPETQALCVAVHLHYCPSCRVKVGELTELGTTLFVGQQPVAPDADCFERTMAMIDAGAGSRSTRARQPKHSNPDDGMPSVIRKLTHGNLESLSWRHIGNAFRYATINMGDSKRETSLMHIKAGGKLPKHHHKGDEITVVLKGSFSDQEDRYHVGDYIVRTSGETHTPVASQDEDCLCLATLDAPIVMNNWLYRLLAPFLNRTAAG
jgi:putative transcriptional regulator